MASSGQQSGSASKQEKFQELTVPEGHVLAELKDALREAKTPASRVAALEAFHTRHGSLAAMTKDLMARPAPGFSSGLWWALRHR